MITLAARKARLKAEYEAMCNIPYNSLFSWKLAPGQTAPYVTKYIVTYNNKTLVKSVTGSVVPQMSTSIQIEINPDTFPVGAPTAKVIKGRIPYHPNVWENGNICNGNIWTTNMWLWAFVIKLGRLFAFDPDVTNTGSPANASAIPYWNSHIHNFPCGSINFCHPKGF